MRLREVAHDAGYLRLRRAADKMQHGPARDDQNYRTRDNKNGTPVNGLCCYRAHHFTSIIATIRLVPNHRLGIPTPRGRRLTIANQSALMIAAMINALNPAHIPRMPLIIM